MLLWPWWCSYTLMICFVRVLLPWRRARTARTGRAANVTLLKQFFGKDPLNLTRVFRDLQAYGILDINIYGQSSSFKGFLVANNYLKCQLKAKMQGSLFSIRDRNLVGKYRWEFIDMIKQLKESKIKMPTPEEWAAVRMPLLTVDGTHTRTTELRDPDVRRNPKTFCTRITLPVWIIK